MSENLQTVRNALSAIPPITEAELEEIDTIANKMYTSDVKNLVNYIKKTGMSFNEGSLTKYERFLIRAKDIYCYQIAKYNSASRARKVASMFAGYNIKGTDIEEWQKADSEFMAEIKDAQSAFKDKLREEVLARAVFGEDKPVFDKYGNQTHTINEKSDRLLEKMLNANCEEYKDKLVADIGAGGGIVFNVVNFATEQAQREEQFLQKTERIITVETVDDGTTRDN